MHNNRRFEPPMPVNKFALKPLARQLLFAMQQTNLFDRAEIQKIKDNMNYDDPVELLSKAITELNKLRKRMNDSMERNF